MAMAWAITVGHDEEMSETFKALVLREVDGSTIPRVAVEEMTEADLPEGDVTVDVEYSSLNYKDGMALTGTGRIVRNYPMVPGVDSVGVVRQSDASEFTPGDRVILTGWGVGERYWGVYSQRLRTRSEWLVPCPEGLSARSAMGIGTAGLTAMLCVMALEDGGVVPGSGPVVVTGAAGGVGSVAVAVLAHLGYEVHAVTGRPEQHDYLVSLGATTTLGRAEMSEPPRPLESETWAGAVDTVGSTMLARVLAQTRYRGTVAACGLAGGSDLPTSVMPFILRSVRLQGVDSVVTPIPLRRAAWERLVTDLPSALLESMIQEVPMSQMAHLGGEIMAGRVRGRVVIDPQT